MFLATASEIFIPWHFLFALPLSKVCAREYAKLFALCVVCKFVKSFLFVVLTLPHQASKCRPFFLYAESKPKNKIVIKAKYQKKKANKLTIWTFSTCCTTLTEQAGHSKHMDNRSKSQSLSQSLQQQQQLHASCQFDFDCCLASITRSRTDQIGL